MSDYSSVAPLQTQQNFSQSSAFAAALQRAKQVKIWGIVCFPSSLLAFRENVRRRHLSFFGRRRHYHAHASNTLHTIYGAKAKKQYRIPHWEVNKIIIA